MTRSDAKKILEFYRPGHPPPPGVAMEEALALLKADPELALWHQQQSAFDETMLQAVASIPIPVGLKNSLVVEPKIIRPAPWWRRRVSLPAAAAVLLLIAIAGVFLMPNPQTFAKYRTEIVEEAWGRSPHVDIATSDVDELNRWVAAYDPKASVILPAGLSDMNLRGGRILDWNHHTVVLLCLTKGGKHLHLFVTHDNPFPDAPNSTTPDYQRCNGWNTVSWRNGGQTFVLTGMNYYTFLKKFRHSGHWQIDG